MKCLVFILLLYTLFFNCLYSQVIINNRIKDETVLLAKTKQISQFIKRFNNEEDKYGKTITGKDKFERNNKQRKEYLKLLFNNQSINITKASKENFIKYVLDFNEPKYFNFHGGKWFAEINSEFVYNKQTIEVTLFLKLQEEKVGSKWVITDAYCQKFNNMFFPDTTGGNEKMFLHPLSHELDFMNLRKTFGNSSFTEYYTSENYTPNHLSILLFEMKNSRLNYKGVVNTKFHVFQIDDWYFSISNLNRKGYNSGWLINNLVEIPESQKTDLKKLILHQNR